MNDHVEHSPQSNRLVEALTRNDLQCQTSDIVIFEAVFTLNRLYRLPRDEIRQRIDALLDAPGLLLSSKPQLRRALDLYANHGMSFADAYHLALMEQENMGRIFTFDRDFDGRQGIERVEPDELLAIL